MPIGEIETHPYLELGMVNGATRLILGSFPVYECTNQDNLIKQQNRQNEGTVKFFYGSNRNRLWTMYSQYIDNTINQPWEQNLITNSLTKRRIAISDTIKSCERYTYKRNTKTGENFLDEFSSEDSALKNKIWNRDILSKIIQSGVTKILCTSKGVLNDLEKQIICKRGSSFGEINNNLSSEFQSNFIRKLEGDNDQITNSIAKVFKVGNANVTAIAIPSPGSPYRHLRKFGCNFADKKIYLENYFKYAFNWLKD